jgi:hypothetical protein
LRQCFRERETRGDGGEAVAVSGGVAVDAITDAWLREVSEAPAADKELVEALMSTATDQSHPDNQEKDVLHDVAVYCAYNLVKVGVGVDPGASYKSLSR